MKAFLAPLWVFVSGNLILLIVSLFLPAVDTAVSSLNATTANLTIAEEAWGWSWLMSSGVVRWIVYIMFEGMILFATAKVFMSQRG